MYIDKLQYGLEPIVQNDTEVLILGSFPSKNSRIAKQYYANSTNRFWNIIDKKYHEYSSNYEEQINILRKHKIGLWDIIESCIINGADDSSIHNESYNDIVGLLNRYPSIEKIILNGKTNFSRLSDYKRSKGKYITIRTVALVSTSLQGWNFAKKEEHDKWYIELPD